MFFRCWAIATLALSVVLLPATANAFYGPDKKSRQAFARKCEHPDQDIIELRNLYQVDVLRLLGQKEQFKAVMEQIKNLVTDMRTKEGLEKREYRELYYSLCQEYAGNIISKDDFFVRAESLRRKYFPKYQPPMKRD